MTMATVKVKATRDFQNAHFGSREKDACFDYDLESDPQRLKADGLVVPAKAAGETKAK